MSLQRKGTQRQQSQLLDILVSEPVEILIHGSDEPITNPRRQSYQDIAPIKFVDDGSHFFVKEPGKRTNSTKAVPELQELAKLPFTGFKDSANQTSAFLKQRRSSSINPNNIPKLASSQGDNLSNDFLRKENGDSTMNMQSKMVIAHSAKKKNAVECSRLEVKNLESMLTLKHTILRNDLIRVKTNALDTSDSRKGFSGAQNTLAIKVPENPATYIDPMILHSEEQIKQWEAMRAEVRRANGKSKIKYSHMADLAEVMRGLKLVDMDLAMINQWDMSSLRVLISIKKWRLRAKVLLGFEAKKQFELEREINATLPYSIKIEVIQKVLPILNNIKNVYRQQLGAQDHRIEGLDQHLHCLKLKMEAINSAGQVTFVRRQTSKYQNLKARLSIFDPNSSVRKFSSVKPKTGKIHPNDHYKPKKSNIATEMQLVANNSRRNRVHTGVLQIPEGLIK